MEKITQFKFTSEEYIERFGNSREEVAQSDLDDALIVEACSEIADYICSNSAINWHQKLEDEALSTYQISVLKDCAILQCRYNIDNNGNTIFASGADPMSNTFANENELHCRDISYKVRSKLEHAGFLYRGVY